MECRHFPDAAQITRARQILGWRPEIAGFVGRALDSLDFSAPQTIEDVLEIDRATRSSIEALMTEDCH